MRDKHTPPPPDAYKNIEAILHGYNIFKGSPFSKSDEGFSGKLFTIDWEHTIKDSHGHRRPRDAEVQNVSKCSSSTNTKIISDEADLQEEYYQSVSAGGGASHDGFTGAFKGGSDFRHESKVMSKD